MPSALDGKTPLHVACDGCVMRWIHLLIECGADMHAKDLEGKTPSQHPAMKEYFRSAWYKKK